MPLTEMQRLLLELHAVAAKLREENEKLAAQIAALPCIAHKLPQSHRDQCGNSNDCERAGCGCEQRINDVPPAASAHGLPRQSQTGSG